ncbi:MAG: hypothetical protein CMP57_00320 [Flavobacteriales bacterium]|nr:hypothetical protein [Flavobacteriales bacterium]
MENSNVDLSLKSQILQLNNIFEDILEKTDDPGLKSSIASELKKQINSLIKLEHKLKKAEKKNHEISLNQISLVKKKLFPEKKLQERYDNMIPFFLKYGESWMGGLKSELNPLDPNFMIFIDED